MPTIHETVKQLGDLHIHAASVQQKNFSAGGPGSGRHSDGTAGRLVKRNSPEAATLMQKHNDIKMSSMKNTMSSDEVSKIHKHINKGNLSYGSKSGMLMHGPGKVRTNSKMADNFKRDAAYM